MRDMPEPFEFPSLDSCQKRFLWTYKDDLAPQPVVGLVLQVGDAAKALGLKSPDSLLRVSKQGPCLTAIEEDDGDKRLRQLKLACEVDGVTSSDPVSSGHRCHRRGNSDADFC